MSLSANYKSSFLIRVIVLPWLEPSDPKPFSDVSIRFDPDLSLATSLSGSRVRLSKREKDLRKYRPIFNRDPSLLSLLFCKFLAAFDGFTRAR